MSGPTSDISSFALFNCVLGHRPKVPPPRESASPMPHDPFKLSSELYTPMGWSLMRFISAWRKHAPNDDPPIGLPHGLDGSPVSVGPGQEDLDRNPQEESAERTRTSGDGEVYQLQQAAGWHAEKELARKAEGEVGDM
ncbi:hypothetical protein MD484_g3099, partial [Candolleomyces efflorescens]